MAGCLCLRSVIRDLKSMERAQDVQEYIIILPQMASSTMTLGERLEQYCHKRYLNHLKKNIFGRLHTISSIGAGSLSCDCCQVNHRLADFAKPFSMLMKLPKENMYVHVDQWNVAYLKSQITELIDIFMYLGATEVSFNVINATTNSDEKGVSGDLSEYGINVGIDLEVHHEDQGKDYISGKILFKNPSININVLFDSSKFHYLSYKFDWQHMIEQRLQSGISSYRVKSFSEDHMEISHGAKISLQKLGVGIRESKSSTHNVMIDMYATFCDLVPNDFSKQSIPILHERWSPGYKRRHSNSSTTSPLSSGEKSLGLTVSANYNNIEDNMIFQEENISKPLELLETIVEDPKTMSKKNIELIKKLQPTSRDQIENVVFEHDCIFSRTVASVEFGMMRNNVADVDIKENIIFQENISLEEQVDQEDKEFLEDQDENVKEDIEENVKEDLIFKEKTVNSFSIDISPTLSLEEDVKID